MKTDHLMIESIQLCPRHAVKVKGPSTIHFFPGVNVVVGPNGSGKTTVLRAIHTCGQCRKVTGGDGVIHYFNSETMNPHTATGPAGNMLKMLLRTRGMFSSHGEIMKAALVSLPVRKGDIVLVDEPESGQDAAGVQRIRKGFEQLAANDVQVIVASHHPLFLQDGRVVELATGYAAHLRAEMCRALRCEAVATGTDDPRCEGGDR